MSLARQAVILPPARVPRDVARVRVEDVGRFGLSASRCPRFIKLAKGSVFVAEASPRSGARASRRRRQAELHEIAAQRVIVRAQLREAGMHTRVAELIT